jgi:prepilin peptidase CpaA
MRNHIRLSDANDGSGALGYSLLAGAAAAIAGAASHLWIGLLTGLLTATEPLRPAPVSMQLPLDIVLVATACFAAVIDLRSRRIPNWLSFGVAGAAMAIRLATGGGQALLAGGEGWLLGTALFFLPFVLGWMGAGDVKLLAAFGALGGPAFILQAAALGSLAGGIIAILFLAWQRKLVFFTWHVFVHIRHPFRAVLDGKSGIPYAPAIALGAVGTMVLGAAVH